MSTASTAWAELRQDIEYGRSGDLSLRMDAWIPLGSGPHPAIVIVHGGAWVAGDRIYNVQPLFKPLQEAGFAWFSISYTLASNVLLFGAGVDDVRAAVDHIRAHAAEYKIDPARIALMGESAGAQLASMAALRGAPVSAVVAMYSPSDLVGLAQTSTLVPEQIRQSVRGTPFADFVLTRLRTLSPIEHVNGNRLPPFLLIHGTADTVVPYEQSLRMCERLRSAGGSCELYTVKGGTHGMRNWERSSALSGYRSHLIDWLRKELHA